MTDKKPTPDDKKESDDSDDTGTREIGGYKDEGLPEPTRFGDWEVKGRCSDF